MQKKYTVAEIQSYRKKRSKHVSKSSRFAILFDTGYKIVIIAELSFLIIVLKHQPIVQIIAGGLILISILLILFNIGVIKKLNRIKETDAVIDNLQEKLLFTKTTYKKFIFTSCLSNPFFVFSGFLLYEYFKYNEIQATIPFENLLLFIFLSAAYMVSLFGQLPPYLMQVKELKESIEDLEDTQTASRIIEETKRRKRIITIVSVIFLFIGVSLLLLFLWR